MTQIQIPGGMRDLLADECLAKENLREKISAVYASYGYRPVETPLIEFYSTYQNTFTSLKEETLYKFVDESGQILTLRTDMTLPIARVCVSRFSPDEVPLRFSYSSSVYKVRQSFAGKRNVVTDCGVELIGLDSRCDLEVLCCALDVMAALGDYEYTLEIGSSDFFRTAIRAAGLSSENAAVLADLVDRKEMPALKAFVSGLNLTAEQADFFANLPLLCGRNALEKAMDVSFSGELKMEVESLISLRATLNELGYEGRVTFDLGKVPHLDYYTGIIFEGYVQGIGTSVLSGGRYDSLLKKLGRDMPAIGFGVKLDYLLETAEKPAFSPWKLYYPENRQAEAMVKARELRKEAPVEMIPWQKDTMEVVK